MEKIDQYNAARLGLNGFKRPVRIHNIKYKTSTNEYKIRCSEIGEDGFTYRSTLYFDNSFMTNLLKAYNKGVRRWTNV
jgi:hypothetical protein